VKDIKIDENLIKMKIIVLLNLMKRIVYGRNVKNMESKYKHAEAYCLMKYKCEKCRKTEILWNSRDGVTPFMINCEKCDGHMQHTDWNEDKRIINYIPKIGQRVFIDMPFDYYKIYCRVRAKMIKENVEGNTDTLQKIYNNLITEYNKKEPYIIKI
jgi:hypothetical protein